MFRSTIIRNARLFSTNARLQKSATETIKDAAKTIDRTVSDAAVKGIEKGGTSFPLPPFPLQPLTNTPLPQNKPPPPSAAPQVSTPAKQKARPAS